MVSTRAISKKITTKITTTLANRALSVAHSAATTAQTAKSQIDQALLNLQHAGLKPLRESQDLIGRIGRGVLERADSVREQIANKPFSPTWLKDISLTGGRSTRNVGATTSNTGATTGETGTEIEGEGALSPVLDEEAIRAADEGDNAAVLAEAASSLVEATVSEPAEEMQPDPVVEQESRLSVAQPVPRRKANAKKVKLKTSLSAKATKSAKAKARPHGAGKTAASKKKERSTHANK